MEDTGFLLRTGRPRSRWGMMTAGAGVNALEKKGVISGIDLEERGEVIRTIGQGWTVKRIGILIFVAASFMGRLEIARSASGDAWAVGTFESLGLYYDTDRQGEGCRVEYRASGSTDWRRGYPLVYDARERQYRGSLVGLKPDTEYEIRLTSGDGEIEFTGRTRSDGFPVGRTTYLPGGEMENALHITESGTPEAWHLVTPSPGTKTVIDLFGLGEYCVVVEANYVILRGLELKNAGIHGVLIKEGVHDVVIEDCHITRWGRIGGARVWGVFHGSDSGIYAETGAGNLVIQRNLIDHPRGGANDWETGHPVGPQAVTLRNSTGGNIVRYNEFRASEDHGFNDGFGGGANYGFEGSPNRDSDIYGNIITHCWDDAIESEGANRNVRIWGNYIDHTFVHIATASTSMGPLYIFRNVFGRSRVSHQDVTGGMMIKTGMNYVEIDGEKVSTGLGYRFIFHNTALQPNGGLDVFSGHELHNCVTRNNIFYARGRTYPQGRAEAGNDFQNDLTGSYLGGGLIKSMFLPSQNLEWFLAPTMDRIRWGRIEYARAGETFAITDPLIQVPNPAIDSGVVLPGFNDDYSGEGPDIGAFENGRPALRFGRRALRGDARAPWELY